MKQITNKEYEEWQKYKAEKAKGHILLPDTVRFICEANGYDAERLRADMVQRRHLLKYIGLILAFRKSISHISFFA